MDLSSQHNYLFQVKRFIWFKKSIRGVIFVLTDNLRVFGLPASLIRWYNTITTMRECNQRLNVRSFTKRGTRQKTLQLFSAHKPVVAVMTAVIKATVINTSLKAFRVDVATQRILLR